VNTDELRGLLSERAARAGAPDGDVLGDVHQTIGTLRRRRTGGLLLAVAAVATGAVLTATTVTGSSSHSSDPVDQPAPAPSRTAGGEAPLLPAAGVALEPGPWSMVPVGEDPGVRVTLDLPAGFESAEWFVSKPDSDVLVDQVLGFWNISAVFRNGCTHQGGAIAVRTPADVADALAEQELTSTTAMRPVTIDGHDGVELELRSDPGLRDYSSCVHGTLDVFRSAGGGGERWFGSPGPMEHYWVVDIDGDAYLLQAGFEPRRGADSRAVERQSAELDEIVESARFELPGSDS
jgi:hypothetical protein